MLKRFKREMKATKRGSRLVLMLMLWRRGPEVVEARRGVREVALLDRESTLAEAEVGAELKSDTRVKMFVIVAPRERR